MVIIIGLSGGKEDEALAFSYQRLGTIYYGIGNF
jgi:hypothetical protein